MMCSREGICKKQKRPRSQRGDRPRRLERGPGRDQGGCSAKDDQRRMLSAGCSIKRGEWDQTGAQTHPLLHYPLSLMQHLYPLALSLSSPAYLLVRKTTSLSSPDFTQLLYISFYHISSTFYPQFLFSLMVDPKKETIACAIVFLHGPAHEFHENLSFRHVLFHE